MQQKDDEREEKHPADMTTDETLDYLFAPEIAERLRREAGKCEPPEEPEPDNLEV